MKNHSSEIESIVEFITYISNQTNPIDTKHTWVSPPLNNKLKSYQSNSLFLYYYELLDSNKNFDSHTIQNRHHSLL